MGAISSNRSISNERPIHRITGYRDGETRFDGKLIGIEVKDSSFRIGCTEIDIQAVINIYAMLRTAGRIG